MHLSNTFAAGLVLGTVSARPALHRRGVDCAFSTTADFGASCESFASSWGMSIGDLTSLNPGIQCPSLDTSKSYCVIGTVNDDPVTTSSSTTEATVPSTTKAPVVITPSSTRTSTAVSSTTISAGNGVTTPLPIQPSLVSNCNKFYYIDKGVSCSQVISNAKISLADLFAWNPSVNADCSGLWAEVNVCVGVIGGATTTSAATTTKATATTTKAATTTTAGNGITTPTPIQPGMVGNCAKFHWIAQGATCNQVISYEKISLANFYAWNPSVKADCSGMWAEVNVCVGVIGGSQPTTTTTKPSTTTSAGNGITTPTPTQPGMVSNCKKFHYVSEGDSCGQIISYEKIDLASFTKWNTGVGSGCNNMWSKTYVCVGV